MIGVRDGAVPWPAQTHDDPAKPIPLGRQAVAHVPRRGRGAAAQADRQELALGRNPRPETIVRYRHVPHDGGNRFQMQDALDAAGLGHLVPRCWRNKPTGTTDVFGRLCWNRPAFTIRTEFYKPEKGRYLHPTEHRPITIREAAR